MVITKKTTLNIPIMVKVVKVVGMCALRIIVVIGIVAIYKQAISAWNRRVG